MKARLRIAATLLALIIGSTYGHAQKKGWLKKHNITVNGALVKSLEVRYDLGMYLGEPTDGGSYQWYAAEGTAVDHLGGSCAPKVYLQLKYTDPRKKTEYIGYVRLTFFGPGVASGKDFFHGGSGSQNWDRLIMTLPGNNQYWPVESAKVIWKQGEVTDFFTVDDPSCVERHKRNVEAVAREKKAKQEDEARLKKDNLALKEETRFMIDELPSHEQKGFQTRLSGIVALAPALQKERFQELQSDLQARNRALAGAEKAREEQNARKMVREPELESQISAIENPADRQAFQQELQRLKTNRNSVSETDYYLLEESVKASRLQETKIAEQSLRYQATIGTMSEDHKSRQEPMKRQQEMSTIVNDRSLSNEDKLRRLEEVNQKLEFNKAVLEDDSQRIEKATAEIEEMKRSNTQSAVAQGATMGALGVGLGASINNARVTDQNIHSSDKHFHFSLGGGLAGVAYPTPLLKYEKVERNDGTGAGFATTTETMDTGYQSSFATGFTAAMGVSPIVRDNLSFGLTSQVTFAPLNFVNTVMGWIESESETSSTTTIPSNSAEEIYPYNLTWNLGGSLTYGGDIIKGIFEAGYGSNTTRYSSNSTSRIDLSGGGYKITRTNSAGASTIKYLRVSAGIRLGDLEDEDATILDFKFGKDLVNSYALDSDIQYLNTGPRQVEFDSGLFPVSSPWLFSISGWKQHRFTASLIFTTGYFKQSESMWENSGISISVTRTFDWRK